MKETSIWLAIIVALLVASGVVYMQRGGNTPTVDGSGDGNGNGEVDPPSNNGSNTGGSGADPLTGPGNANAPELGEAPSFKLMDEQGQPFGSEQLAGKVWLVNFIFTRCQATCPEQTSRMQELQDSLKQAPAWAGIHLLSISVDPEYDQPEVLQTYAEEAGAIADKWTFLTGEREKIWQISKQGFRLPVAEDAKNSKMPIMHDSKFVLVDRRGRIRGYFDLLRSEGRQQLQQALNRVLPEMPVMAGADPNTTHLAQPPEILHIDWFEPRQAAQEAALAQTPLRHQFKFHHAMDESGIDYTPQIVDDQRWRLQVNHYDHGCGVAVADVDGDDKLDVYFVAQAGPNALFRNLGDGKFENITDQAQVAVADRVGVAAAFADVDNDGDADLFVTTVRGGNLLLTNDGKGVFTDVSKEAGVDYQGHSSGAVFFDYDLDGDVDLFVTNVGKYTTDRFEPVRLDSASALKTGEYKYYVGTPDSFAGHLRPELSEPNILYRNDGKGIFTDVTQESGLVDDGWSGAATPLDVNQDGWMDIYILNMQGSDAYFENVEGKFQRKTADLFPSTPWGAMGVKSFDYNRDGRFDLFVTDMHSDMSEDVGPDREKDKSNMQWAPNFLATKPGESIFGNAFYEAQADGSFKEVSDAIGAENYWPWGLSVDDVNADGYDDAFLASSMCFPYRYSANSLLLNNGGKGFIDSEFAVGVEPRLEGKRIKPWFELDADGLDKDNRICEGRSGKVMVWSALGSRSSAIFDIDEDGDLDIITNDFNSPPLVLVNDLTERSDEVHWLKIRLEGAQANRDGLGAVVTVVTSDLTAKKINDGQSGYLAQSRMPLYFGLGSAMQVDRIEVDWPGGKKQTLQGPIPPNQTLVIRQTDQTE